MRYRVPVTERLRSDRQGPYLYRCTYRESYGKVAAQAITGHGATCNVREEALLPAVKRSFAERLTDDHLPRLLAEHDSDALKRRLSGFGLPGNLGSLDWQTVERHTRTLSFRSKVAVRLVRVMRGMQDHVQHHHVAIGHPQLDPSYHLPFSARGKALPDRVRVAVEPWQLTVKVHHPLTRTVERRAPRVQG
jgi:hypothetical protein